MLIGIDGNEANVEKRVGIGEYAFELLGQFYETQNSIPDSIGDKSQNHNSKFKIYLKNRPISDFPKEQEWWKYSVFGPNRLWTQFVLPLNLYLSRPKPEVFFSPTHYAPRFSPIPTVISIMDLSYIHFPELFRKSDLYQLKNWTSYSVKKAKKILTISEASKNDIIKMYKAREDKVVVTYPGIKMTSSKLKVQSSKLLKEKYGIEGDYILFVGTLQPRKNIVRLIEAFSKLSHNYSSSERSESRSQKDGSRLRSNNKELQLVIVGKKGWMYEDILKAPKKFGIEDKVRFLDFVSDEDLQLFYQNALCFVLCSLYEGFGLPVVEAMKYGCPVITSSVSSLPEAGGEAALYVDPENVNDIASKINRVLEDNKLREEMIKKGHAQAKKFSWEKTAKETLRVLEEVAVKNY